jgi:hypothetical protein
MDRLGKGIILKAIRDIIVEIIAKWFTKTYYY